MSSGNAAGLALPVLSRTVSRYSETSSLAIQFTSGIRSRGALVVLHTLDYMRSKCVTELSLPEIMRISVEQERVAAKTGKWPNGEKYVRGRYRVDTPFLVNDVNALVQNELVALKPYGEAPRLKLTKKGGEALKDIQEANSMADVLTPPTSFPRK